MEQNLTNHSTAPINDPKYISPRVYSDVVNESSPKPHPIIIENAISDEDCKALTDYFDGKTSEDRAYQGKVDKKLRNAKYVLVDEEQITTMEALLRAVLEKAGIRTFFEKFTHTPVLYKYPPGIGFTPHHDMVTVIEEAKGIETGQPVVGGDYTFVWFLNSMDENQGGELVFHDFDQLAILPKKGTVVGFRVDLIHSVRAINHGIRYSAVSRYFVNPKKDQSPRRSVL